MSIKPTGKSIAEFRERIIIGTRLECVQNTSVPERVGAVVEVTALEGKVFRTRSDRGRAVWNFPSRVSDVVALTDDSITYRSGCFGDLITWKVVAA